MSRPRASLHQKVNWLLCHPQVWQNYPSEKASDVAIFKALQAAGLFHTRTNWFEADIARLVSAARKRRRLALRRGLVLLPN